MFRLRNKTNNKYLGKAHEIEALLPLYHLERTSKPRIHLILKMNFRVVKPLVPCRVKQLLDKLRI